MKFIPLNAKDRSYIDEPRWNWQYIRGVQRILNVLKGTVMTTEDFFYRAFGENEKQFIEILNMPESIIMNRTATPKSIEKDWLKKYRNLTVNERNELLSILNKNRKKNELIRAISKVKNKKLKSILEYYQKTDNQRQFDFEN